MSALLSPAEQQEATRFGIFDEEAFREIAEHADDDLRCECLQGACGRPAVARMRMKCCGIALLECEDCLERQRRFFEGVAPRSVVITCTGCRHQVNAQGLDDFASVVPL
ncbi:hypothetical protein [Microbacterium sp. NPDC080220]|uniref:hypothetical protein n=1 Tax=Microbacterium sp. NPDC080220 TaxID=3161017 RepID=UPI0034376922